MRDAQLEMINRILELIEMQPKLGAVEVVKMMIINQYYKRLIKDIDFFRRNVDMFLSIDARMEALSKRLPSHAEICIEQWTKEADTFIKRLERSVKEKENEFDYI